VLLDPLRRDLRPSPMVLAPGLPPAHVQPLMP
jgi:hypothetical protein